MFAYDRAKEMKKYELEKSLERVRASQEAIDAAVVKIFTFIFVHYFSIELASYCY